MYVAWMARCRRRSSCLPPAGDTRSIGAVPVPTSPRPHVTVVELPEGEEAVSGLAFAFPFPCGGVCACAPARFEVTEDSGSSQQHEHGGGPECFARAGTASER